MANNQLIASDTFASGSLAAGWSAWPTLAECTVVNVPPQCAEAVDFSTDGQLWTGLSWPNDQTCEVTINAYDAVHTNNVLTLGVRVAGSGGAAQGYLANFNSNNPGVSNLGTLQIYTRVGGSPVQLGTTQSGLTFAVGDVLTFQAAGSCLTVYQNGKILYHFYDAATPSGGAPGFFLAPSTTLSDIQVSAWRGYNGIQQDGIWQKQGVIIPAILADLNTSPNGQGIQVPTILFDNNAQILSGSVYKAWLVTGWGSATAANLYYAESSDGISWTRRGTAVLTGYTNNTVFKSGSTYYMLCQAVAGNGTGTFQIFTSSDGISWALQSPSQTISLGGVGTWDHVNIYPGNLAAVIGGTFYVLYLGYNGTTWATGIITSTDGINWVKSGSNPVLNNALPQSVNKIGSTYYGWFQANQPGQGNGPLDPIEVVRYSSPDLITWTKSAKSVHHSQLFEDVNDVQGYCVAAGGRILDIGGKAHLFINTGMGDANGPQVGQLSVAIGPAPIALLVTQPEDAAQQIASDNFQRADGGLGANWTTLTGRSAPQIASHLVEPTTTAAGCGVRWSGAGVIGSDQYSEITIQSAASTSLLLPVVRAASGATTWYQVSIAGALGSQQVATLVKWVAGANSGVGPQVPCTASLGDVFRLQAIGNVLSLFQNGFLLLQVEDNDIASGSPGFIVYDSAAIANAQISAWAGGNANVTPTYPNAGSGGSSIGDLSGATVMTGSLNGMNATLILSPRTSIMGTNLRTRIIG